MTAQIRPNRMEVSDRFPMLGFAVRTDEPNVEAEVVLASDIGLFAGQNRNRRTAANFYSSREHGTLTVPRGEGVFVVPPDVLARFIGSEKIYFGLATGHGGNGGLNVDAVPRDGSPYVSLRGFTGRTLRRSFGGTRGTSAPRLEWTGDAPKPGSEGTNGTAPKGSNDSAAPAAPQPAGSYDDGFGPMPSIPARETAARSMSTEDQALIDFPEDAVRMGPIIEPSAGAQSAPVTAMVAGADDYDKARRLARDFTDIFMWTAPSAVVSGVNARGFSVQPISAAAGDLSLDFYKVDIARFPNGYDGPRLLEQFITTINSFLDSGNTEFIPYDDSDRTRLSSSNKVGTAFKLDIEGPDNAAVVISDHQTLQFGEYYAVTTIETPWGGSHPVSGHRQFGYYQTRSGWVFYTRGADRSTAPIPGTEWMIWQGADSLWRSFQSKLTAFINNNGGEASARAPFSERFNATAIRLTYGNFDAPVASAQSLALPPEPSYVPPLLPSDPRQRANRIGGGFGQRIGEALDLGLDGAKILPLLDALDPPPTSQPMSYAPDRRSQAMAATTWSINWDGIAPVPQPTGNSCWATTLSMLVGWRDSKSIMPSWIAQQCGRSINDGLPWANRADAAAALGLGTVSPQCYTPDGFKSLIENHGPLYVGKIMSDTINSGHAVLVVGMYSDGSDHFLRVVDPWDRAVGSPGAPDPYSSSHATGSSYIMRYDDFQNQYEMATAGNPAYVQIIYAGVPAGRTINTGTGAPVGFAQTAIDEQRTLPAPPPPKSRTLEAVAIAGIAIDVISNSSGDIKTNLSNWAGIKHPGDVAPRHPAPFLEDSVTLRDWPVVGGTFGIDDIYCWLKIRWQYNGTSLGHIYIEDIGHDDAAGWGLTVNTTIEDDSRLYARSSQARSAGPAQVPALHVNITYTFDEVIADDQVANTRVTLYADGTYDVNSRWVQHSRPGGGNPTVVTRPFQLA